MELYIHVPFCASKCIYCDFASWSGKEDFMSAYVDAVIAEAEQQAAILGEQPIETIFIGGGTPSILPPADLDRMLDGVLSSFPPSKDIEFTSEANPGTLTPEWLNVAVHHGINRISLGMQAYQPELLQRLGRIHHFEQVESSVALCRAAGIHNINLDLMFGLPGQSINMWQETLDAALSLHPQHLSCYGLIPEPDTSLLKMLENGYLTLPDEETERTMYDIAIKVLASHGFEQYEISNFALSGYACRHNIGYWRQVYYLGLGASAASMLPQNWKTSDDSVNYWRTTNPRSIKDYLDMINHARYESRIVESISHEEARFETWMLGLRTTEGISEHTFETMHGESIYHHYGTKLDLLKQQGLLIHLDNRWFLSRKGMDLQNAVLVELMDDN